MSDAACCRVATPHLSIIMFDHLQHTAAALGKALVNRRASIRPTLSGLLLLLLLLLAEL